MNGLQFLRAWALPHFYFHLVTAYDILRHNGVVIDKQDYFYPVASIGSSGIDCIRHPSSISWTDIGVHPPSSCRRLCSCSSLDRRWQSDRLPRSCHEPDAISHRHKPVGEGNGPII